MNQRDLEEKRHHPFPPRSAMLHCVGCGNPVARAPEPGDMLAISCRCGAYSPILVLEAGLELEDVAAPAVPGSLLQITEDWLMFGSSADLLHRVWRRDIKQVHWERYLGPEPATWAGRAWLALLIAIGMTSMADCEKCRREHERMTAGRGKPGA